MRFRFLNRFKRAYKKLPKELQEQVDRKLELLAKDPKHPSLRVKRVKKTRDIWEATITMSCRITFQIEEDLYIMRNVGEHDHVLREP
jgi:mRNA-degrading endonuclease RelE of RelBE toxin-antitoxin system